MQQNENLFENVLKFFFVKNTNIKNCEITNHLKKKE